MTQATAHAQAVSRTAYGLNFGPFVDGADPNLNAQVTAEQILSLMTIVAPYTKWIRSYGSTHGLEDVPAVARQFGLKVAATASIGPLPEGVTPGSNSDPNMTEINGLIANANLGLVDIAIVGTEPIRQNVVTVPQLIQYMQMVRAAVPSTVKIATSDIYPTFLNNPNLIAASDVVLANFYPYWEGTSINYALCSLEGEYLQLQQAAGSVPVVISETGWPSGGNTVGAAVPGANASLYENQFLSWASANSVPSFYFEAFDEPFKSNYAGPQDADLGIWNSSGVMKPGMGAFFSGTTTSTNCVLPGSAALSAAYIPPYGVSPASGETTSSNDWLEVLAGGINPANFTVAAYIKVNFVWYSKPTLAQPTVPVNASGSAAANITTGGSNDYLATDIAAFLIPATTVPPVVDGTSGALPSIPGAVGSFQVSRTASSISGLIADAQGKPIAGAVISDPVLGSTTSAPDGRYSFYNVTVSGQAHLTVSYPNYYFPASPLTVTILTGNQQANFTGTSVDLSVVSSVSPNPGVPGSSVTENIVAANAGLGPSTDATVTATIPASFVLTSVATTNGACSSTSTLVSCDIGPLANGAHASIALIMTPSVTGQFTLPASVSGPDADPNTSDKTVSQTVNILTAQTITFPSPGNFVYPYLSHDPALFFRLTVSTSSGLGVNLTSNTPSVCIVNTDSVGEPITITTAGDCSITATQPGDSTYAPATPVTQVFTISQSPQVITVDPIPNVLLGVTPFQVAIVSTSGLPVAVTVTTPAVCRISSGQIMILGVGQCSITASQPGNIDYTAATTVTRSFTVSQAKPAGTLTAGIPVSGKPGFILASADFNGDGIPDLASASDGNGHVTILLGDGAGGFSPISQGPIATSSLAIYAIAVADLNGDGIPDIIAGGDGGITILRGYSGDTWAPMERIAIGWGAMAVVDFNGDGIPDLALTESGNQVAILVGSGSGSLGMQGPAVPVGNTPSSVVAGDFNRDGIQDFAVANGRDNNVTVMLGNGSGGFIGSNSFGAANGSPFAVGSDPNSLVVGDFNQDGIQDIAVANYLSNNVTVLLGDGSGSFAPAPGSPFAVDSNPGTLVAGDFNGDGFQDLAVRNTNTIDVLQGDGSGRFAPGVALAVPSFAMVAGDFNGDGVQDLATSGYLDMALLLTGGPAPANATLSTTSPLSIAAGQAVALTLAVSNTTPAFSTATGTATFLDGNISIGTASQASGPYTLTASALAVGTHTITALYSGDSRTAGSTSNAITIQVGMPQTITFGPLPNVPVATAPFALSGTSSSGLTVGFTSGTPNFCSVSGTTVTILGSGGCSITATQTGDGTYAPAPPVNQRFTVLFSDVAPDDIFYNEVNAFAQYGITNGCGGNQFCPGLNVTRDEMAIFIVRAIYGNDNFTYTTTPYFTDVQPATFGFKWIQKLKDLGITNGCTATSYCPSATVSRDQMAVFIIRARLGVSIAGAGPTFTYPSTPYFSDATAGNEFAYPWIQRMRLESITNGCTPTTYCPLLAVTREAMATFIMRGAFNRFLQLGTPILSQISPSTLARGTSGTFTITGTNTNLLQGATQLSPIPGVTIGTITVVSPLTMTVQLSAASSALTQPYSILAITGSEQDVLPNGLVLQ